jgi:hypothetical protein
MGSAASTISASESKAHGDKIVPLNQFHKQMHLYQHNNTGEVLVLVDENIDDYLGKQCLNDWFAVKLSDRQEDYFSKLKVVVAVNDKNVVHQDATVLTASPTGNIPPPPANTGNKSPPTTSNLTTNNSNSTNNSSTAVDRSAPPKTVKQSPLSQNKYDDEVTVIAMETFDQKQSAKDEPYMTKRLKVLKSAAMDGRDISGTVMDDNELDNPAPPKYFNNGKRTRTNNCPRKFTPISYFLHSESRSITMAGDVEELICQSFSPSQSAKECDDVSLNYNGGAGKKVKPVLNLNAFNCSECGTIFYGSSSREAMDDHQLLCRLRSEVRSHIEYINGPLMMVIHAISFP